MRRTAISGVVCLLLAVSACQTPPTTGGGTASPGGLDTTFGYGYGWANLDLIHDPHGSETLVGPPVVLDDGTIVHASYMDYRGNPATPNDPYDTFQDVWIETVTPAGHVRAAKSPPVTLDANGDPGCNLDAPSIAAYPGGRMIVTTGGALYRTGGGQVFRLDQDVNPDPTFANGRTYRVPATYGTWTTYSVRAVATDSVGRVLIMSQVQSATGSLAMVVSRLDTTGAVDASFGTGGWALVPNSEENVYSATPQVQMRTDSLDRVVLSFGGTGTVFTGPYPRITRLTEAGVPDPTWTDVVPPDPSARSSCGASPARRSPTTAKTSSRVSPPTSP